MGTPQSPLQIPHSQLSCLLQNSPSWEDVATAIKLKFVGDMIPSCPWKGSCRVRDDSGVEQEEEDPIFCLHLFLTLQESFGLPRQI